MKKKFTGFRLQVLVLIFFVFALAITCHLSPVTSLAQQSPLLVTFNPTNVPLKTNEEKIIKVSLSSDQSISAFDLNFQTSGGLSITGFVNSLGFDNNFDPFKLKQVAGDVNSAGSRIGYILNAPSSQLPKRIDLFIKIRGSSTGQGKITLNYNSSQVLSGGNSLLQISPNQSAAFDLNNNQSSPGFIDPTSVPAPAYPENTARVNLKLKLYGSENAPANPLKGTLVAVGRVGDAKYETTVRELTLTPNPDGTYSANAAFPDFRDGNKFSLMVKVDKYLLRRVCTAAPTESALGGYNCTDPNLTILRGENNFDFTGMSLIPGDLGVLDGLLNAYDLSLVRNNLNKNTKEAVALADLNYDGAVDEKDFEIIKFAGKNTKKEADQ